MKREFLISGILFLVIFAPGCRTPQQQAKVETLDYDRPLPPGELALRRITDPAMIPDFTFACYEVTELREAVGRSLNYLNKPSSRQFFPYGDITHEHAAASLRAMADLLDSGLAGRELAARIRDTFDVYISVGCDNRGTVLFTGYYTPIFAGSKQRTAQFQYPLYKQPADLVKGDDGAILGKRGAGGTFTTYPSRGELTTSGQLVGSELVWLSDPFEVYVAHVQGSAKIRLPDGQLITVGYAANNGHEYKSIARKMVTDGAMRSDQLSLKGMIDYFKTHPGEAERYIAQNPRFVFFQMSEGDPRGSLNEPVTTMRTIATDKAIYPRACLAFLSTDLPSVAGNSIMQRKFTGFVLDQDAGGAIRAPGRCDVYMGVGDEAGRRAGNTYQEGKLYYLFLRSGSLTASPWRPESLPLPAPVTSQAMLNR
ncbi:MAG: MltA domain-containing protein [Phycisphaerae bacterium]|nr:MltA domain-containing protein [Phycisphaerae bacterium]